MSNPSSTYDLTISTPAWLATAYGDTTIAGVVEIKKIDEGTTLASASETTATSWWADSCDDGMIAIHTALSRARKTWRAASVAALEGLGSDDGLAVGDYGWPDDGTPGDGVSYQCDAVTGPASSTWTQIEAGSWYRSGNLAIASGESLSADRWDSWDADLTLPGIAELTLPLTGTYGDRIRVTCGTAVTGNVAGALRLVNYGGAGNTLDIPSPGVAWRTANRDRWLEIEHDGGKWYLVAGDTTTTIKPTRPWIDDTLTTTRYDFDRDDPASTPTIYDPAGRHTGTVRYPQFSAAKIGVSASASHGWTGYEVALPATAGVRITVRMWASGGNGSYNLLGLMLRDATNKLWGLHYSAGIGSSAYQLSYFSTPTTYTSNTFARTSYTSMRCVMIRATKGVGGWVFAFSEDDGISWITAPDSGAVNAVPGAMGALTHLVVGISSTVNMAAAVWIDSICIEESPAVLPIETPAVRV